MGKLFGPWAALYWVTKFAGVADRCIVRAN